MPENEIVTPAQIADPTPGAPTGETTATGAATIPAQPQIDATPETPDAGGDALSPEQQKLFDRLLAKRLEGERAKFKDYADLKKAAVKLKEIEDAAKTEEQKTQEKLTQLQAKVVAAETDARNNALKAAVTTEAARQRVDPKLALKIIDTEVLTQGEDGEYTNLSEHLQAKIKEYGLQPRPPQAAGPANPARDNATQGRSDKERFQEYFGGGGGGFWTGGGVVTPKE